jgi:hypothetical protein
MMMMKMFHTNPDTALEFSSNPPRGISVERRQKKLLSSFGTNFIDILSSWREGEREGERGRRPHSIDKEHNVY